MEAFGDLGLDFCDFGKLLVYVEFGWISRCFKGRQKSIESGIVVANGGQRGGRPAHGGRGFRERPGPQGFSYIGDT